MTGLSIGIDFGTTNTVVALAGADGPAHLVRFPAPEKEVFAFRSALSFYAPPERPNDREVEAGPWAIEAYVEDPLETRFIQSFKSFAASESFTETQIIGRRYVFEDLLSAFLLKLRDHAGADLAQLPKRVIVGRPVTFAGGSPNEELALKRYETAFQRLGFEEILYSYEPVGAAFFFARELTQDATVLVGDFGGGTSDFSIIRFTRENGEIRSTPLGRAGVGVAGDAFDYRIIDNLVSPELGKGSSYKSFGKILPVPNRYYSTFARWDQLALMRASRDMREIRKLVREAVEPEKIERLVEVLDENYGYRLYRAVSALKEALSSQETAEFRFEAGSIDISRQVERAEFEDWIAPELHLIEDAVDRAMSDAGLNAGGVDRVFLTGGSSLVPAVRDIFYRRFDAAKIESGSELESIASGLALMGRERDLTKWARGAGSGA
ncbi:molecular chaperone Hsp70 [Phenylobacterium sp. Root77]|uniref:Hsp70 family protein n=1 Tax=unclassified Phenylobacterium TaxID=2640670 RepID=UPI0006FEE9D5|nr:MULTISPECIES: Hsp70 family protein [unclassified Phenylobacterium]KQW69057.1 molecular chaperone Hsp70 [Phenylobacterium sp. Root1277]KQW95576.1 molecular chaperone Hsp70 [Phenylobacterium sp. Root1290]KRC41365.1 molecular chaperone Hsp70 [Phenylobacterium sp. Root77]